MGAWLVRRRGFSAPVGSRWRGLSSHTNRLNLVFGVKLVPRCPGRLT